MIAALYNIPINRLYNINNLKSDDVIYRGDVLKIDFSNEDLVPMEINGYVYPDQDIEVLIEMLPSLTYLSIFSYNVRSDGTLNNINDEELIRLARGYRVAPMMVITNIDETDTFSSDLASTILSDEVLQDKLIENILVVLREKNYYGIDIDFEYIYPDDRIKYNSFLKKITERMHEEGYKVSTAVAPKTSDNMEGLLYEAHDYKVHGEIVDRVIIMTYEWGYTFSEAMPVAPLNKVRDVIEYAVTRIPSYKILLGVPNYGYDFRVPRIEEEAARSITNNQALDIARENQVRIEFGEDSRTPFFNYYDNNNVLREVHFEDARSIRERVLLAIEYDLAGLSFWTLRSYHRPTWLIINEYIEVIKLI